MHISSKTKQKQMDEKWKSWSQFFFFFFFLVFKKIFFYRKQCAEPVDFLRVLWASIFVELHHELLTATKQHMFKFTLKSLA